MNWDDLKLLLQVSRTPKLTDAAEQLGQDATTLSRRLRRLETDLSLRLFDRTRRGHILTPEGQEIAQRAELAEQTMFDITRVAEMRDQQISGRVRLGVTEGLGTALIAPAVSDFTRAYPGISLDLIAMSGFANVSRREADMSIMLARPTSGRLKLRKLTDYVLRLYSTEKYLADKAPITRVEDLSEHVLIGYMDEMIYSPQLRYYDEISPGLMPFLSSPSIIAQQEMTRSGAGVAILPQFLANRYQELVPVLPDHVEVTRSFWLVVHEDVAEISRIRAVSDFLTKLMATRRADLGT